MSSEYTPTTEQVEDAYAYDEWDTSAEDEEAPRRAAFRRWHAAELADAERRGAVRALREAADALSRQPSACKSPGCHRADQITLESRADQIEEDG